MIQKPSRNTALRQTILDIFQNEQRPLTIPELTKLLDQRGFSPNKTSLYRQMETLSESGNIQKVTLTSNVAHFELAEHHHHHHFVCTDCSSTICLEDESLEAEIAAMEQRLQKQGLTVHEHQFSLAGICNKCL